MFLEVSIGESVDKATILLIKSEKIRDDNKLKNVLKELNYILNSLFVLIFV